jgi:DNA-binding response OmpR family regulator
MAVPAKKKKTILVAEDDPSILRIISMTLSRGGITVIGAADGEQAWQIAQRDQPDAIVLDIQLPKIDGLTLCSKLKGNMETAHIPVGFLTAQVGNESYEKAKNLGGLLYMPKPFNPDRLLSFVQVLLASRREFAE